MSPTALFKAGREMLLAGERDKAREAFSRVVAIEPAHAPAHLQLAGMDVADGLLMAAHRHLEAAAEVRRSDATVLADLGAVEIKLGRWEAARAHLERSLQLDPGHAPGRLNLARLQAARGAPREALRVLEEAPSDDSRLQLLRGQTLLAVNDPCPAREALLLASTDLGPLSQAEREQLQDAVIVSSSRCQMGNDGDGR